MWKLCCAAVILFLFVGGTRADEFNAIILGVKDGKVTYTLKGRSSRSLPVADGVKVAKVRFVRGKATAGEPIEGGLGNGMFTKISKEGVPVILVTSEDGKITAVLLRAGKKK